MSDSGTNKGWFGRQHIAVQGVVVISGVVLTSLAVWQGWKFYKGIAESKEDRMNVVNAQSTLNTLSNQGIRPTYPPAQYSSWANSLQKNFDGYGVNWASTRSIFAGLKNDADVYALIKEYATRTIDATGWGTGDFSGDLASTLSYKFSGSEGIDMKALYGASIAAINKIMRTNGISFQF